LRRIDAGPHMWTVSPSGTLKVWYLHLLLDAVLTKPANVERFLHEGVVAWST
jgi:hypothetical protein